MLMDFEIRNTIDQSLLAVIVISEMGTIKRTIKRETPQRQLFKALEKKGVTIYLTRVEFYVLEVQWAKCPERLQELQYG
uniref:Uncharacterized protein n=1 Tax=Megaselia scalaris TaxID=36166 RepID=T1H3K2_MEGSC